MLGRTRAILVLGLLAGCGSDKKPNDAGLMPDGAGSGGAGSAGAAATAGGGGSKAIGGVGTGASAGSQALGGSAGASGGGGAGPVACGPGTLSCNGMCIGQGDEHDGCRGVYFHDDIDTNG